MFFASKVRSHMIHE